MNNLVIRNAATEDAKKMIEYLNQVGGETDFLTFGKNEFHLSVEEEEAFIESTNHSDKNFLLVGTAGDQIVSVGSLQGMSRERISHRGEIAISVRKDYWNQGIGTKMLMELIKRGKEEAHMTVIQLTVNSDNKRAIALYEKLGFEKIGLYKKYSRINGKYRDSYLMNLYLENE